MKQNTSFTYKMEHIWQVVSVPAGERERGGVGKDETGGTGKEKKTRSKM